MAKNLLSIFLSLFILFFITFTSYKTYTLSISYDKEMFEKAELSKIENKLDNYLSNLNKNILTTISKFLSYENPDYKQIDKDALNSTSKNDMQGYLQLYFLGIGALLLTYFISSNEVFIISLLSASILSWVVGIFAPMMTIEIYKELPILGYSIFKYDSKSIYATIQKLWLLQNYFVFMMLFTFSILVPLLKTIALYFSVLMKKDIKFIEFIGRWAMADVFIVALLLTNLSLNADEFTNANIQVAIYFFSTYVVFSILSSYLVGTSLKQNTKL